jgi:outer membrane receptor for ferrienterochelin and colicins
LEHKYNRVKDAMPGYFRQINQRVHTYSFVSQIDYDWRDKWCMMLGARLDHYTINGRHLLLNTSYQDQLNRTVLVPRIAVLYHINPIQQVRLSFTRGYRGPQAFDEDLHIETVGGAAKFIQLDPHLQSETSQSWTGSYQFYKTMSPSITGQLLIEGFLTTLRHPFILTNPYELPNGTSVVTKSNGDKAYVYGSTVELNLSYKNNIQWQSGITYQSAQYSKAIEIWAPQNDKDLTPKVVTKNLLRTPSFYGFYTLTVFPNKLFDISYNCVITGRMHIGHVTDSETEYIQLKTTRSFWEHQLKLNYKYPIQKGAQLHIYFGITNLTNQYQKDFDMGMHRDATYIYGPNRPRTLFFGCKLLLDGSIKKG